MLHAAFRYAIAGALLCLAYQAHAAAMTPVSMVQLAYDQLSKDGWSGTSDPAQVGTSPPQLTAKWFTAKFIAALKKDAKCWAAGKEGIGPIWYNGQDYKIENIKVQSLSAQRVQAQFTNFGKPQKTEFIFQKAGQDWRIDNVLQNGQDLYAAMMKGCAA